MAVNTNYYVWTGYGHLEFNNLKIAIKFGRLLNTNVSTVTEPWKTLNIIWGHGL